MPEFAPSELKTAIAPITVKPAGLNCEAEIFLGPDEMTKVVTSGRIPFTSTGASQDVRLPVVMPDTEGTFHVYADIYAEGLLIAAYQAIEDVVIAPVGVAEFAYVSSVRNVGTITYPGDLGDGTFYKIQVDIKNIGTVAGICHPRGFMRYFIAVFDRTETAEAEYGWYRYYDPVRGISYNKFSPAPTFDLEPGEVATFEWHVPYSPYFSNVYTWAESEAGVTEELRTY